MAQQQWPAVAAQPSAYPGYQGYADYYGYQGAPHAYDASYYRYYQQQHGAAAAAGQPPLPSSDPAKPPPPPAPPSNPPLPDSDPPAAAAGAAPAVAAGATPGGTAPAASPAPAATAYDAGVYGGQAGQGYGAQQAYDYAQYYSYYNQQHQQQGGYPGYGYGHAYAGYGYAPQYGGAASAHPAQPPPPRPPQGDPAPASATGTQPPLPPSDARGTSASASAAGSSSLHRPRSPRSYHAVPPPSALQPTHAAAAASSKPAAAALTIKHAIGSKHPLPPASSNATPRPPPAPAYTSVAASPAPRGNALSAGTATQPPAPAAPSPAAAAPSPAPAAPAAAGAAAAPRPPAADSVPPALTAFVTRCLGLATPGNRDAMKTELMRIAREARSAGTLWTTDWDRRPVPQVGAAPATTPRPSALLRLNEARPSPTGARARRGWDGPARPDSRRGAHSDMWGSSSSDEEERSRRRAPPTQQRGASKAAKRAAKRAADASWDADEAARRARRAGRFDSGDRGGGGGASTEGARLRAYQAWLSRGAGDSGQEEEGDWSGYAVVGISTRLEKEYLRLTSAPNPEEVRPQAVLAQALARLVRMLAAREANYPYYYCSQFKAMRQDCTVQQLRNALTVQVYEAHARAALEYGDWAEYNQCQTQLAQLYAEGVPGCAAEFAAYKVLYHAVHAKHGEAKAVMGAMRAALGDEVGPVAGSPQVAHALRVREAIFTNNWAAFFRLYATAPALSRALLDLIAPTMRFRAITAFCAAGKQGALPLSVLVRLLGFWMEVPEGGEGCDGAGGGEAGPAAPPPGCSALWFRGECFGVQDEALAAQAAYEWAKLHGAVLLPAAAGAPAMAYQIDCKASAGQLAVPQDTSKVAHGDANMSFADFVSRVEDS